MPKQTYTEYAVDYGDEIDDGYISVDAAKDDLNFLRSYYAETGRTLEGKIVKRTVTTETTDWEEA